ncbi:hypothetical protein ACPVPU_06020 [Sphingomonas sp. CJ99]
MSEDGFIAPGTHVRLDSLLGDDGKTSPEYGVVVHCWFDDELSGFDCYVAFFGAAIPNGTPNDKPYVLRYAATSLTSLSV